MAEEESQQCDELRKKIEAKSPKERIAKLDELATELFITANSFAGGDMASIAVYLHESSNNIRRAEKIFNGEIEDQIPIRLIARSTGIEEPMISLKGDPNA